MSTAQPPMPRRRIASILWFPIFFAIALPVTFEVAYHQPQPRRLILPPAPAGPARARRTVLSRWSPGAFRRGQGLSVPGPSSA